jgi:hypothetical protein
LPLESQKDFLDFLQVNAPPNTINLAQMNRLFQVIAKMQYARLKQDQLVTPSTSSLQHTVDNLAKKVKIAFRNANELMAWMDISGSSKIRIEEFWFGLAYFSGSCGVAVTSILFDFLDQNRDGFLQLEEIQQIFEGVQMSSPSPI